MGSPHFGSDTSGVANPAAGFGVFAVDGLDAAGVAGDPSKWSLMVVGVGGGHVGEAAGSSLPPQYTSTTAWAIQPRGGVSRAARARALR